MHAQIPPDAVALEVIRAAAIDGLDGNRAEACPKGRPTLAPGETFAGWEWAVYARLADGSAAWIVSMPTPAAAARFVRGIAGDLPVTGLMRRASA